MESKRNKTATSMNATHAVTALTALAHETRLAVFRLLVQAGPDGLPVGALLETLGLPAPSLSFHLKELSTAHLVVVRRDGRFLFYSAAYDTMNGLIAYLNENCCAGSVCDTECCTPTAEKSNTIKKTNTVKKTTVKARTPIPGAKRKRPTIITTVRAKR